MNASLQPSFFDSRHHAIHPQLTTPGAEGHSTVYPADPPAAEAIDWRAENQDLWAPQLCSDIITKAF